jgi:5-(aminomethyl)-3-furanmethanol phosphate kinase
VPAPRVETVVKLGGSVLAYPDHFASTLSAIAAASRRRRLLVVPGGGPFADVVRDVDRRFHLPDASAHRMAVLAMDQYALVVVAGIPDSVLVTHPGPIADALEAGRVPVLSPSQWLSAADPLPHSWDVTSDSIAAWVAGEVGARRLVLIKAPGAAGPDAVGRSLVDAHFYRALPQHVMSEIVAADQIDTLRSALDR